MHYAFVHVEVVASLVTFHSLDTDLMLGRTWNSEVQRRELAGIKGRIIQAVCVRSIALPDSYEENLYVEIDIEPCLPISER